MKRFAVLLFVMFCVVAVQGQIVYVDANSSNTTVNGQGLVNGVNYADGSNSILDNLWGTRPRSSVNGGYVWTTDAPSNEVYAETTEPLIVSMTIAAPAGEYRVFGLFNISQQGSSDWDCAFSVDGENYINCTNSNATRAQISFFDNDVIVEDVDGTSYLFIIQLATVTTTTDNEQVSVYVQGVDAGDFDNRTWFEGIAYQPSSQEALIPEPFAIPDEPDIQPQTFQEATLNKKDTGFRGIWYYSNYQSDGGVDVYKYHYAGGLGTYCTRHRPMAVYCQQANKTFFCYGGAPAYNNRRLWHMAAEFDHSTGQVSMPTLLLDKQTGDAHDNPTMNVDGNGHIWIFSTSHGTGPVSYIHKSKLPYDINEFELVESTKIDANNDVVPFTNFSYFQPWSDGGNGFGAFLTIYDDPVKRTTQFMHTADGINWSKPQKISIAGRGAYQISCQYGNKLAAAFNYHPDGEEGKTGVLWRTNLYYVQTLDYGQSWQTVDGSPVTLPLETEDIMSTNMLVRNGMSPEWKNIYLTDIRFDNAGNPIILHLTAAGGYPGPESDPRYLEIAHWDGSQWVFSTVTQVDHNYDGGSLYIEDGGATWRIIGTTGAGPQAYGTGGEVCQYTSVDNGITWTKVMDMTSGSSLNHNHVRRPLNANPDFYGFWADGNSFEMSESSIYYCDKAGNVTKLPRGTGPAADDCDYLAPEDVSGDCQINFNDYAIMAESWQQQASNLPSDFAYSNYTGLDVDDSFEVNSVGQLPYNLLSGSPANISTERAYSADKSLYWSSDEYGYYGFDPFSGQSLSNTTVSINVYLPSDTNSGRAILGAYDASLNDVLIVVDRDTQGEYDILYRIAGSYTRSIENIGYGWHQLSFAVYANNAVGIYCDEQYIATADNFTSGLTTLRFGKPWSAYKGMEIYYDDLKVNCNTDVVGGGRGTSSDIYEDFEYTGIDGFAQIGGYSYIGDPTFSDIVRHSASKCLCTANDNSTLIKKVLPAVYVNCRLSAWVYVPYYNSGRSYLKAISQDDCYAFVGLMTAPDRVYYRHETNSYTGFDIDKGWHLMSIIVDYQGHFHMFFDNYFLGEHTTTTGIKEIDFGNPWSSEGYAVFDSLTFVDDVRGGFTGDWNTIYKAGDFNQDGRDDIKDAKMMADKWLIAAQDYDYCQLRPAIYLTFDDRFVSQWVAAMPVFDQYNAKATFCVTYFDLLSQSQIDGLNTLKAAGHAVACHSLRHLKAVDYIDQYSIEEYWLNDIEPALNAMAVESFVPACFAYPYSQNDQRSDRMLLEHFKYLRSGLDISRTDKILINPAKMKAGGMFYGTPMDSNRIGLSALYSLMDEAIANGASIIFYGHNIADEFDGHYTTPQRLHDMISYGQSLGFEFKALDWK